MLSIKAEAVFNLLKTRLLKADGQVELQGDLGVRGGLTTLALANADAPTVAAQGTTGATSYGYKLSATVASQETAASSETTIANGNATLSSTNYNRITWTRVSGATGYKVYRTTGGATQGLIGTITSGATLVLDDTGLAGGGETPPTINTTGHVVLAQYVKLANLTTTQRAGLTPAGGMLIYNTTNKRFEVYQTASNDWSGIQRFYKPRTGEYIRLAGNVAAVAHAADTLIASPFEVVLPMTIDRLSCHVSATGTATNARLGVYANGTNNYPGALLLDSGALNVGTTGIKAATVSLSLQPGLYWLAVLLDGTCSFNTVTEFIAHPIGASATDFTLAQWRWTVAKAYGTLPDPFTASGSTDTTVATSAAVPRLLSLD